MLKAVIEINTPDDLVQAQSLIVNDMYSEKKLEE